MGCSRTIIAGSVFDRIPEGSHPELQCFDGTLLSADDSPIRVFGKAIMNIQLGDKHGGHMVLVAEIANEGLIGTDFLRTHGIIIDFANHRVTFEGQTIIAKCQEGQG